MVIFDFKFNNDERKLLHSEENIFTVLFGGTCSSQTTFLYYIIISLWKSKTLLKVFKHIELISRD